MKFENFKSFKNYKIKILLLISISLILFREIDLIINPRFWAEEGSVYFYSAYNDGLKAILYSHQGYFSLIPNISTYLSTLFPLKHAPIPTLIFSFVVMLIPAIIIIYSSSKYLQKTSQKFLAILIIYLTCNTEEVWLNTINSQFWFVIILFLILIEDKTDFSKAENRVKSFLVVICGLSGVPANILAPFFLLKYLIQKNKVDLRRFFILLFTTIIQLIFIVFLSDFSTQRAFLDFEKIVIAIQNAILGIVYSPFIFNADMTGKFAVVFAMIILLFLVKKNNFIEFFLLFSLPFFVSMVMTFTSLEMKGDGRYYFSVAVIYVFLIFYFISNYKYSLKIKLLAYTYVLSALFLGVKDYDFKDGFTTHKDWHKWSDEVRKYERGEQDHIALYPQWNEAYWTVKIPRKKEGTD